MNSYSPVLLQIRNRNEYFHLNEYAKFTSEHNKITEAIDEYLAGHKNNKPRGTRVSLELDNNPGRILQFNN